MRKYFILISIILVSIVLLTMTGEKSFYNERDDILSRIDNAIEKAKEEGRYNCCIDPACTMCYLGEWIWEDGSCYCNDMIAEENWDKVCPQCLKGIKEGRCKSSDNSCPII